MPHAHRPVTIYRNVEVCRCGASRTSSSADWQQLAIIASCEYPRQHRHRWVLSPIRRDNLLVADEQSPHFDSIRLAADTLAVRIYEGGLLEAAG